MPTPTTAQSTRFGNFEVDFLSGELRKLGLRLKLAGMPMQVLEILLERPGEMVTRDTLRNRLWPEGTFVDFENSLNTAVNKLRAALGDTAAEPRYIETLPRRGYRFIAPVEKPPAGVLPRIVVLPFENLSTQNLSTHSDEEYFADGLTEELIAHLGRAHAGQLGVIARTSAMHYKNTRKTAAEISRELAADYLLEGSIRREGGSVRITAQLIRSRDEVHLWAETFDRTLDHVLSVQSEVAAKIGSHLALQLLPEKAHATVHPQAYEAFLKGRFYWNKRTEAGLAKAVECYEHAIALQPNYAMPYVGLADIYNVAGLYSVVGWASFGPPEETATKARAAAQRALQLDPTRAEAHTSLAFARFLYDWDWAGAEAGFRQALQMNPNDVASHGWFALYLNARGRTEEALRQIENALKLDPLSLVANAHKGWLLYFARRYSEALLQLETVCEMDPAFPLAHYVMGLACGQTRAYADALRHFTKAFESLGHPGILAALRGQYFQALRGKHVEPVRGILSAFLEALMYISMGRKVSALDALEAAYAQRSCWLVNLKAEPAMDSLRGEPRFIALLDRMGL